MSDVAVPNRPDTPATPAGSAATARLGPAERALAFALVGLFLVALVVMYRLRDDQYWDRLLFLFGPGGPRLRRRRGPVRDGDLGHDLIPLAWFGTWTSLGSGGDRCR